MAIAGFVIAIVGFFILPIILGPLGLIFSAIGLRSTGKKRGLAIAGLIISVVNCVWVVIGLL